MEKDGCRATAQSGLRRLMLKLPAQRQLLQKLPASSSWRFFCNLIEAYDEGCVALEAFRRDGADRFYIEEYETMVAELEADVVRDLERVIIWPNHCRARMLLAGVTEKGLPIIPKVWPLKRRNAA
ncbi:MULTISPECIES: nodulation protein [unclassified Rhizobium]|uniref:nodulation protein n=1 Tax=unclassified Rhizobium TaxID=2613769 RepID=UPI0004B3C4AB|nr:MULTISPECIES: nodulation protein [unclassified Rhizobium]NMN73457.1 hypothetical protein [Rhizobium sp. 57MFTsu3.2]